MAEQCITEGEFSRFRKSAEAVKDAVPIMDVAPRYVDLRRQGANYVGLCPFHNERTPSFNVCAGQNRFYCYGCRARGDVIDLHRRCGDFASLWDAMVSLAEEFGVQIPVRPERWHKWQDEKGKIRDAAKQHLARTYQRRLTRVYAPLVLVGGMEPEEELEQLEGLSSALWPIALEWAERRVNGQ